MSTTSLIHKFEIDLRAQGPSETFAVDLPAFAEVIHAAEQFEGSVAVWYRFRQEHLKSKAKRHLVLVPTGAEHPSNARYLATAICYGGRLVLHLMEA